MTHPRASRTRGLLLAVSVVLGTLSFGVPTAPPAAAQILDCGSAAYGPYVWKNSPVLGIDTVAGSGDLGCDHNQAVMWVMVGVHSVGAGASMEKPAVARQTYYVGTSVVGPIGSIGAVCYLVTAKGKGTPGGPGFAATSCQIQDPPSP